MAQETPRNWFTERCEEHGSAFSLETARHVYEEQTPYQRLDIYETTRWGYLMTLDGLVMLTSRDNFLYHEMMSHPALFTHADPKRVVIIGGGDCGTLREVLRHPGVEHCLQVEIDERVTRLSEEYFPELCEANDDPRAELHFGDGIAWMKQAPADSVDLVIIDSTDPIGPAEGLFGEPFYRNCFRALGKGGILVQQSESPLLHFERIIQPMHKAMRAAGFSHTRTLHFPQPVYPSGWWSATMARKGEPLDAFCEADARARPFPTRYYNAGLHQGALALPQFMLEGLPE